MNAPLYIVYAGNDSTASTTIAKQLERLLPSGQFIHAPTGNQAWEAVQTYHPLIVMAQENLSDLNGFEFLKKVKALPAARWSYLLLLTEDSPATRKHLIESNADDILGLPIENYNLYIKLRNAVRHTHTVISMSNLARQNSSLQQSLEASKLHFVEVIKSSYFVRFPDDKHFLHSLQPPLQYILNYWQEEDEAQKHLALEALPFLLLGKTALPEHLAEQDIISQGKPTDPLMVQVPLTGATMLAIAPEYKPLATIIQSLFENMDGSGFPNKLKGSSIPWQSRVLRVVYEFMLARKRKNEKSMHILERMKNAYKYLYDPLAVRLMEEYVWKNEGSFKADQHQAIRLGDLRPGDVLVHDIISASGLKIAGEGTRISSPLLERLMAHCATDSIIGAVFIRRRQ